MGFDVPYWARSMPQRRGRVQGPATLPASESRINEERRAEHKQGDSRGPCAALIGAVPPRRPPRCRATKAFTRITTAVPQLDSLAAAAAHSHCICTSVNGGAPGGRGRAYAARHRACGPLAVGQQPPRSDACAAGAALQRLPGAAALASAVPPTLRLFLRLMSR